MAPIGAKPLPVFAYGTLMSPKMLTAVLQIPECLLPIREPATLEGYSRYRVRDAHFPAVVLEDKGVVDGVLVHIDNWHQLAELDWYETDMYERQEVVVITGKGKSRVLAYVYVWKGHDIKLSTETWDYEEWERDYN